MIAPNDGLGRKRRKKKRRKKRRGKSPRAVALPIKAGQEMPPEGISPVSAPPSSKFTVPDVSMESIVAANPDSLLALLELSIRNNLTPQMWPATGVGSTFKVSGAFRRNRKGLFSVPALEWVPGIGSARQKPDLSWSDRDFPRLGVIPDLAPLLSRSIYWDGPLGSPAEQDWININVPTTPLVNLPIVRFATTVPWKIDSFSYDIEWGGPNPQNANKAVTNSLAQIVKLCKSANHIHNHLFHDPNGPQYTSLSQAGGYIQVIMKRLYVEVLTYQARIDEVSWQSLNPEILEIGLRYTILGPSYYHMSQKIVDQDYRRQHGGFSVFQLMERVKKNQKGYAALNNPESMQIMTALRICSIKSIAYIRSKIHAANYVRRVLASQGLNDTFLADAVRTRFRHGVRCIQGYATPAAEKQVEQVWKSMKPVQWPYVDWPLGPRFYITQNIWRGFRFGCPKGKGKNWIERGSKSLNRTFDSVQDFKDKYGKYAALLAGAAIMAPAIAGAAASIAAGASSALGAAGVTMSAGTQSALQTALADTMSTVAMGGSPSISVGGVTGVLGEVASSMTGISVSDAVSILQPVVESRLQRQVQVTAPPPQAPPPPKNTARKMLSEMMLVVNRAIETGRKEDIDQALLGMQAVMETARAEGDMETIEAATAITRQLAELNLGAMKAGFPWWGWVMGGAFGLGLYAIYGREKKAS